MTDWSTGTYEHSARQLEPVAELAIEALQLHPGQTVIDVACGTGNAAIVAGRAGAKVTGVDLAERLLGVARDRATAEGLNRVEFVIGDATRIPVPDGAADAAVSVMGVIFAEPQPAARELLRIVRPGGRIAVTSWLPAGPFDEFGAWLRGELNIPDRLGPWAEVDLVALFAPHAVEVTEHVVDFVGDDLDTFIDEVIIQNPVFKASEAALAEHRPGVDMRAKVHEIIGAANRATDGVRYPSPYRLVTVQRS